MQNQACVQKGQYLDSESSYCPKMLYVYYIFPLYYLIFYYLPVILVIMKTTNTLISEKLICILLLKFAIHFFSFYRFMFRLGGNPICTNANIPNIGQFCDSQTEDDGKPAIPTNSKCPTHECPLDNFYEYEPASGDLCACAAPLRIGYRLQSPNFYYFPPYANNFSAYVTTSLNLSLYQLSIDSFVWEEGPRLRMYLKLFPPANTTMFSLSEVHRIGSIFTSGAFSANEIFGPYELLNFTLLGPYASSIYLSLPLLFNLF